MAPVCLPAQTAAESASQAAGQTTAQEPAQSQAPAIALAQLKKKNKKNELVEMKPFSRVALSGGISLMGVNLQVATNVNRYINIRGVGNVFQYTDNNIDISDVKTNANLNFASAGVMVDYYPFPKHGFRLSPGFMFYNQNRFTATGTPSTDLSLNDVKYYSDPSYPNQPIRFDANVGLNQRQQAFVMTSGWGNIISRAGKHWSFPFEIGAVFTGSPTLNLNVSGMGCFEQGGYETCGVNMATNSDVQDNLKQENKKYQDDVNALTVYPVISFGVAYNFKIRK
jgi:hypothetical protein